MPTIDLMPVADIDKPKLQKMMQQARDLNVPDDQFFQILAHAPGYAESLFDAMHMSHAEGNVDHKIKEIIRIQLARLAEDPYFSAMRSQAALDAGLTEDDIEAGCGDFLNDDRFTEAEKWALNYGYLMFREPGKVNTAFYNEGKKHYSEAQITELGAFIALHYGLQVFWRTLQMTPQG